MLSRRRARPRPPRRCRGGGGRHDHRPEARTLLVSLLGSDRLASRSEIAKLLLYAHGSATITAEHVEQAVADASAQANDDAVDAAFSGDLAALDGAVGKLHLGPVEAGLLLGAALRHATALHRAKLAGSEGESSPFRFGLSPRRKATVDRQLATLDTDALARTDREARRRHRPGSARAALGRRPCGPRALDDRALGTPPWRRPMTRLGHDDAAGLRRLASGPRIGPQQASMLLRWIFAAALRPPCPSRHGPTTGRLRLRAEPRRRLTGRCQLQRSGRDVPAARRPLRPAPDRAGARLFPLPVPLLGGARRSARGSVEERHAGWRRLRSRGHQHRSRRNGGRCRERPRPTMRRAIASRAAAAEVRATPGWHFLVGDPGSVSAVADAVGFRSRYDVHLKQFLHPAGLVIVTPEGRVSGYVLGVGYHAGDVRTAVTLASTGGIATGGRAASVAVLSFRCGDGSLYSGCHESPTLGRLCHGIDDRHGACACVSSRAAQRWIIGSFEFMAERRDEGHLSRECPRAVIPSGRLAVPSGYPRRTDVRPRCVGIAG